MTADAPVAPLTPRIFASNLLRQTLESVLIIAAIHAWPAGLAVLVRGLRWPQLVRPLALTLVGFDLIPVYVLIGLVAATVLTGGWAGLAYRAIGFLDPSNLIILVFGLSLRRAAWRADGEFRRLTPDAGRKAPLRRRLGGRLALTDSAAYSTLLACYLALGRVTFHESVPPPHRGQPKGRGCWCACSRRGLVSLSQTLRRRRGTSAGRCRSGKTWPGRSLPSPIIGSTSRSPA